MLNQCVVMVRQEGELISSGSHQRLKKTPTQAIGEAPLEAIGEAPLEAIGEAPLEAIAIFTYY